jgi:hypothetical protein
VDGRVFGGEGVLGGGSTNVALAIPITFKDTIDGSKHHVMSEIEFTFVVEEGFFDVGLDDVGTISAIIIFLFGFKYCFDLLKRFTNFYTITTIRELTRFDNPNILFIADRFLLFTTLMIVA